MKIISLEDMMKVAETIQHRTDYVDLGKEISDYQSTPQYQYDQEVQACYAAAQDLIHNELTPKELKDLLEPVIEKLKGE